jgi:hypothetical protein
VIEIPECPKIWETTVMGTPLLSVSEAAEWRRVCSPT